MNESDSTEIVIGGERSGTRIRRQPCTNAEATSASQTPVILIHGVGLNHEVWAPQVAALCRERDVYSYDTLGHGESASPPENSSFTPWVDQLLDVMDSANVENAHLVGHSMGALISIAFALAQPDRVKSIIPIAGVHNRTPQHAARARATATALLSQGPVANLENAIERWYTDEDQADPVRRDAVTRSRQWLSAADAVGYARAYSTFANHADDFNGELGRLQCPALYISAEFDPNSTPAMSDAMAAATTDGTSRMVKNERHMLPLIAPQKINPLIEQFIATGSLKAQP